MESSRILNVKGMLILAIFCLGGLFSCIFAPVKEREEARILLEKAESVESLRFAKEEFSTAKTLFDTAVTFFVAKGKSKKNVKSRDLFLESSKNSQIAYDKSLQEKVFKNVGLLQEVFLEIVRDNLSLSYPKDFQELKEKSQITDQHLSQKEWNLALTNSQHVLEEAKKYRKIAMELQKEAEQTVDHLRRLLVVCQEVKAHISDPKKYDDYQNRIQNIGVEFTDGFFQMVIENGRKIWIELEQLVEGSKKKRSDALKSYAEAIDMLSSTKKNMEMSSSGLSEDPVSTRAEEGAETP